MHKETATPKTTRKWKNLATQRKKERKVESVYLNILKNKEWIGYAHISGCSQRPENANLSVTLGNTLKFVFLLDGV
eukprot:m.14356 g.14356  ORF g.14356 m.14356 type:complete len:76 (-) comp4288_c0_seq1:856-1083(-)